MPTLNLSFNQTHTVERFLHDNLELIARWAHARWAHDSETRCRNPGCTSTSFDFVIEDLAGGLLAATVSASRSITSATTGSFAFVGAFAMSVAGRLGEGRMICGGSIAFIGVNKGALAMIAAVRAVPTLRANGSRIGLQRRRAPSRGSTTGHPRPGR